MYSVVVKRKLTRIKCVSRFEVLHNPQFRPYLPEMKNGRKKIVSVVVIALFQPGNDIFPGTAKEMKYAHNNREIGGEKDWSGWAKSCANFERTRRTVYATASFIINIDTLYTCKDTYVIAARIARSPGCRCRLDEKCIERTCNTKEKKR